MLIHYGADELYCGVSTPEWEAHFGGGWWMNRRSPAQANLLSREDLQQAVDHAHSHQVPVQVAVNAPFYPQGAIRYLLKLAETLVRDLAIDGLIVSDLNLLCGFERIGLPAKIHLSSLGSCFNSRTAEFYRSLGVTRIILPRQVRGSEIRELLTRAGGRMEFEAFVLNDGCYFEEGFCQTSHTLGTFCLTEWSARAYCPGAPDEPSGRDLSERSQALRTYLWYQNNCGSSFQEDGLPNGPCSLCRLGEFSAWGMKAVKIAGREASFYRKMRSLQMVKAVMDEVRGGMPPEEVGHFARSLRNTPEYCDHGSMCYFRG